MKVSKFSIYKQFERFCDQAFSQLQNHEKLNISLEGEDSLYLRFNKAQLRQNLELLQIRISLHMQSNDRESYTAFNLTSDETLNLSRLAEALIFLRGQIEIQLPDPHLVPIKNNGHSQKLASSLIPSALDSYKNALSDICEISAQVDLVGIFAGGLLYSASFNSLGQKHWFEQPSFLFDYSIYSGEPPNNVVASKSCLSGEQWSATEFSVDFQKTLNLHRLQQNKKIPIAPGKYKAYLAPAAVDEVLGVFRIAGLGYGEMATGRSPFLKLHRQEKKLSNKFSLQENFELGLHCPFNQSGELSDSILPLVHQGKLQQFLTSSRSAAEYQVNSNFAESDEILRSPEILPGNLDEIKIFQELDTGLYLSHLHYVNWSDLESARITGMTRFAALWVENGKVIGPIQDMRFDVSLYSLFGDDLLDLTKTRKTFPNLYLYDSRKLGGSHVPGILVNAFTFTF